MDEYGQKLIELIQSRCYPDALNFVNEKEPEIKDKYQFFEDRSMIFGLLGEYENSIKDCDSAINIDPNRQLPWFRKGVSLYHLRRFDQALIAFDECLQRWPHMIRAIELKISTLIFLGNYHKALKLYESSDLPSLHDFITYNNLGLAYLEIGNFKKSKNYLTWAQIYNFRSPVIYYNFCRLYYKRGAFAKSLLYGTFYIIAWTVDKVVIVWQKLFARVKNENAPTEEKSYFAGPGRLFSSNSQQKEKKAILKLLRSPNFWALCNDTFGLVAANLPFDAVDQNGFKGDIDILISMPRKFPPTDETPYIYRGFEVKVISVDYSGKVISPKRNPRQLKKIKIQLDKLRSFGCEQTFLLEIIVLERGFSEMNTFPPENLKKDIAAKAEMLKDTNHGYVVIADEPTHELNDEAGGRLYFPLNILRTSETTMGSNMNKLANAISNFKKNEIRQPNRALQQVPVITYCNNCRMLTYFNPIDFYHFTCIKCDQDLC